MTSPLAHFPKDWLVASADVALKSTLARVLRDGADVEGSGKSASLATKNASKEILAYQIVVENTRDRVVRNPKYPLNAVTAIARFVWMMAGSDRLADIAYYEPRVSHYTDDGISIPGSSYGHRIVQVRPGINQLTSGIERLKENLSSRRVAITIFQPEDVVRDSHDIPCAFGLFYHVRGARLYSTLVMRSNNAVALLPFNIFEFSLLAEVVACETGVEPGPFVYQAASMHVFEPDFVRARDIIAETVPSYPAMSPMPHAPRPLDQIASLIKLEAQMRHKSAGIGKQNVNEWIEKGHELHSYWRQFYYVLLAHVVRENRDAAAVSEVFTTLDSFWRVVVPEASLLPKSGATAAGTFSLVDARASKIVPISKTRARAEVKSAATRWEEKNAKRLSWQQFSHVEETLADALAAREGEPITDEEFSGALASLDDGKEGG